MNVNFQQLLIIEYIIIKSSTKIRIYAINGTFFSIKILVINGPNEGMSFI